MLLTPHSKSIQWLLYSYSAKCICSMPTGTAMEVCCFFLFFFPRHSLDSFTADFFFPNGKLSATEVFKVEGAILGKTGRNPGKDFFLI